MIFRKMKRIGLNLIIAIKFNVTILIAIIEKLTTTAEEVYLFLIFQFFTSL